VRTDGPAEFDRVQAEVKQLRLRAATNSRVMAVRELIRYWLCACCEQAVWCS
jgi:hypothetical protein